jgi:hypothetical protein
MKFYITEKTKQEIEDKIVELETNIKQFKSIMPTYDTVASNTQLFVFKEILSSATILPIYKSLSDAMQNKDLDNPNGIIIQPTNK